MKVFPVNSVRDVGSSEGVTLHVIIRVYKNSSTDAIVSVPRALSAPLLPIQCGADGGLDINLVFMIYFVDSSWRGSKCLVYTAMFMLSWLPRWSYISVR